MELKWCSWSELEPIKYIQYEAKLTAPDEILREMEMHKKARKIMPIMHSYLDLHWSYIIKEIKEEIYNKTENVQTEYHGLIKWSPNIVET